MRSEDAPLEAAVAEYLADAQLRLKPSSLRTYVCYLQLFLASIDKPQLRHLTPVPVKTFVNRYVRKAQVHAAHNAMIALKAFSTYLAKERIFYGPGGAATLAGVDIPAVPKTGRPAYTEEEVLGIQRVIATHPNAPLLAAVHWLQLATGIRATETRLLRLRDVTFPSPTNDYHGHIVIREDTTKTAAGAREIPLDHRAAKAIRRYMNDLRPAFSGEGAEPVFLTQAGTAFSEGGWHMMQRRLRRDLQRHGITGYKQHRNRNTWTRDALEAGIPETAIVQMGGWGSVDMLRRYHGKLTTSELKRYPTTLAKYGASRDNTQSNGLGRTMV
jgi:integrase